MSVPLQISFVALGCILAGAIVGRVLRSVALEHYLNSETRDVVKLCVGLIATLTALVLGLLVATAKNSHDVTHTQIKQLTANVTQLDLTLTQFGPDALATRTALRRAIPPITDQIWSENRAAKAPATALRTMTEAQELYGALFRLAPQDERQRVLRDQALKLAGELAQTRLALFTSLAIRFPGLFWSYWFFGPQYYF